MAIWCKYMHVYSEARGRYWVSSPVILCLIPLRQGLLLAWDYDGNQQPLATPTSTLPSVGHMCAQLYLAFS